MVQENRAQEHLFPGKRQTKFRKTKSNAREVQLYSIKISSHPNGASFIVFAREYQRKKGIPKAAPFDNLRQRTSIEYVIRHRSTQVSRSEGIFSFCYVYAIQNSARETEMSKIVLGPGKNGQHSKNRHSAEESPTSREKRNWRNKRITNLRKFIKIQIF